MDRDLVCMLGLLFCIVALQVPVGEAFLDTLLSSTASTRTGTATDRYPRSEAPTRTTFPDSGQFELEQRDGEWTSWSPWSTCSSSVTTGFRVRNRVCSNERDCEGDDVQLIKCNQRDLNSEKAKYRYSKKYIDFCKKKYSSLSCKLYLENPDLAYDIFRQNSCFFTQEDGRFRSENNTVPIPNSQGETNDNSTEHTSNEMEQGVVFSFDSTKQTSILHRKMSRADGTREEQTEEDASQYRIDVLNAMLAQKKCKAACDKTICLAARLWAKGTQQARTLSSTIGMLGRSGHLGTGVAAMFYEYNSCNRKCTSILATSSYLTQRSGGGDDTESAKSEIKLKSGTWGRGEPAAQRAGRRKRNVDETPDVKSLCGVTPACTDAATQEAGDGKRRPRRRQKRQTSEDYVSPCFSKEDRVPEHIIEDKVRAQLFFFESHKQIFSRRRCDGDENLEIRGLYNPKESVLQGRTDLPAYCKQGFLTRHGLFILDDPRGPYFFETGERFSIESRQFQIESHCEIVVRK